MTKIATATLLVAGMTMANAAGIDMATDDIPEEGLTPRQVEFLKAAKFFLDPYGSPEMESAHLKYDRPCIVWTWKDRFTSSRIEFDRFPALSEIRIMRGSLDRMWSVQVPIPHETVCTAKVDEDGVLVSGSSKCSSKITFGNFDRNLMDRRLKALQTTADRAGAPLRARVPARSH